MRISDWSSDVCSSDLLQGAHLAGPAVDQVGWIQAAEQDDVLHALQDVVRHIGNGVRVGVDGNDGHEPRKPFGSKTRDCSFAFPAASSLDAAVARSRAVTRLLCLVNAPCTHARYPDSQGKTARASSRERVWQSVCNSL